MPDQPARPQQSSKGSAAILQGNQHPTPKLSKVHLPHFLGHPSKSIPPFLIIYTCFKVLLIPAFRSTDFDVHRNWLAITHNLPIAEWYFNDVNGGTVHTLDYPPAFAFFEWILSNNPITHTILQPDDRCLNLLPDDDNTPSDACIVFQRSTVIVSDIVLWLGAYLACRAIHYGRPLHYSTLSFLLIAFNPGLLWLDHIHFQYNGMLLGVLLGSLGMLLMGNHTEENTLAFDFWHLAGAATFAFLLNLKHLYLPLAPLYFCYLLERYCLRNHSRFQVGKFLLLAAVTATTLVLPWIPFLVQDDPKAQFLQIIRRLFPFGRGVVHDYWAANLWAVHSLANKLLRIATTKVSWIPIDKLPEPTPLFCGVALLVSIIPGLQVASARLSNTKLIQAVVYCSLCSFMLAWHVHEKAIMTTLIPLTLLIEHPSESDSYNLVFFQMSIWGLLGLFPLLFSPVELAFKLVSYVTYLTLCSFLLKTPPVFMGQYQTTTGLMVTGVVFVLEFLPIQGKWEFLPLMITSIVCANGLIGCWILTFWLLIKEEKIKTS